MLLPIYAYLISVQQSYFVTDCLIATSKWNMLQHKKMNDCAFVSYIQQMASRFQKRRENAGKKDYDPLITEDFDWDNERG
jgi:hypothetical protein